MHIHVEVRGQLVRIVLSFHLVSPKEQLIRFGCRILYPLHSKISLAEFSSLNFFFLKIYMYMFFMCVAREEVEYLIL